MAVSVFVNPSQFDQSEDYVRYPRPLAADLAFCAARGVDVVFAPPVEEMYPRPQARMGGCDARGGPSWKAASGRAIFAAWRPWC